MKTSLSQIPLEPAHNSTVPRKRLIRVEEQKGKIATLNYAWLEADMSVKPHIHPDGEEYYFFLKGNGEMLLDKEWFPVKKDDFITVPPQTIHSVRNNHKTKLEFLALRTVI